MTAYSVAIAKHATLTAGVVDMVTLTGAVAVGAVEILNRGTSGDIYFTTGTAVAPTVGGNDCYIVQPGQSVKISQPYLGTAGAYQIAVQLICSTSTAYSVTGVGAG